MFRLDENELKRLFPLFVVETEGGQVTQVIPCRNEAEAEKTAREFCEFNGIVFEGLESVDENLETFSVQIFDAREVLTFRKCPIRAVDD